METIAKVIKAFFFGEDGEVDTTFIGKLKKALTWIVIGGCITIGALCYWADDEDSEQTKTEITE